VEQQPDEDAIIAARVVLDDAGEYITPRVVEAYRVLAKAFPSSYLAELAKGLLVLSYLAEGDRFEVKLALTEEAAAVVRQLDESDPGHSEPLLDVLHVHQRNLQQAGRRSEAVSLLEDIDARCRAFYAAGRHPDVVDGSSAWACALAEEGRHAEAAEVLGSIVDSLRRQGRLKGAAWTLIEWASELEAAGRLQDAIDAQAVLATMEREEFERDNTPMRCLLYALVHLSQMLGRAGRTGERLTVLTDARPVLAELAESGERKSWSGYQDSYLARLLTWSGRPEEPTVAPGELEPPLGFANWSSGYALRLRLQETADQLREAEIELSARPDTDVMSLVRLNRRIMTHQAEWLLDRRRFDKARPVFDRGVDLALQASAIDPDSRAELLIRALLDRAQMFTAHGAYAEGLTDFDQAITLVKDLPPETTPSSTTPLALDKTDST
jgi:tetratricopeptide (TPR) repeat protein